MSWWENIDDEFQAFLANLFAPAVESSRARGKALSSTFGKPIKEAGKIIAEENKAGGVKSTPSTSPSPASTASGNQPPPVLNTGSGNGNDDFRQITQDAQQAVPAARQTQGSIFGVDPDALVYTPRDPQIKKTQVGPQSEFAPKVTKIPFRTLGDVAQDVYGWDDKRLKTVAQMMVDAGYIKPGADRMDIASQWARLAAMSALMYSKGKRVAPLDLLRNQSFGGIGNTGPRTETTTNTNYTVTNATTAKQLAQAALSQRVGRKATDAEVAEFISELREEEKANPQVTTTTTTTNPGGTSSSSTSTTKQGVNLEAFQRQWTDEYDTEEAKAYQAAGIMMPWFFDALKAPA